MLVLFETPAGYALFKAKSGKLSGEDMYSQFETPEAAGKVVKLTAFEKFADTTEGLAAATAAVEGKLGKGLKKFLKENIISKEIQDELAVSDPKIGKAIQEKLGIKCSAGKAIDELMRGIRLQLTNLITGLKEEDINVMALGLSHSLSRYKLKFSPDKVDTMIVQAISLLDDLDKELNTYSMRVREWYGWHFPELSKLIPDNMVFARLVLKLGKKENVRDTDLSDVLPEDVEAEVKEQAEISMGFEISDADILHVQHLCEQVVAISEYRALLYDYLKNRMNAIAPNLTVMVGDLVGARLIAHAGSLLNLAKHPASTVQILGAEKALFRALKTKHDTPKYGLLYHASVVGQSAAKNKGKMSRVLAAKTSLVARVDALADEPNLEIGLECRAKVDARMRQLEGLAPQKTLKAAGAAGGPRKFEDSTPVKGYNDGADSTLGSTSSEKKKKKKKEKKAPEEEPSVGSKRKAEDEAVSPEKRKKKKKKSKE